MECMFNTQSDNVAAYCKHHHCCMTVKQIKTKNCLGKQCWYLIRNEEHNWWKQREITKKQRKDRKTAIQNYVSQF